MDFSRQLDLRMVIGEKSSIDLVYRSLELKFEYRQVPYSDPSVLCTHTHTQAETRVESLVYPSRWNVAMLPFATPKTE